MARTSPVQFIAKRAVVGVARKEKLLNFSKSRFRRQRGGRVNFHAIAGRQHHAFSGNAGRAQFLKRAGDLRLIKGEPFPQFHGGRMMVQADNNDALICW